MTYMRKIFNKSISDISFVVIDLETTGFAEDDDIIDIAAIKVKNQKIVDKFHTLLTTDYVPDHITRLTGIDISMLRDAPYINSIKSKFTDFIKGCILVGHNISRFDKRFLVREFELNTFCIDTMHLSKELFPYVKEHNLEALTKRLDIKNICCHRALSDATITAKAFMKILALQKERYKLLKDITTIQINTEKRGDSVKTINHLQRYSEVTSRRKKVGNIGEDFAEMLLKKAGFTNVYNLNEKYPNTPYADIYAVRKGNPYVISVKTRNKYEASGVLNGGYKLGKNCYEFARIVERQHKAEPAWVAVALEIDRGTYDAYFGTLASLRGNLNITMSRKATRRYECLAEGKSLKTMCIGKIDYKILRNAYGSGKNRYRG